MIATETELKLATRPEHLPALTRLLEARAGAHGASETLLVTAYFDSPDGALARRGLTLRVRKREGSFVQTVKSAGGNHGAPLVRGEWEDPVAEERPEPGAPQTGRLIPPDARDRLVALVRTEITRRIVMFCPSAETRVEAAVDQGHVVALSNNAREPICEIEFELKHGAISALYDLALEMLAVAPVRIERRGKSARGFRLAASSAAPQGIAAIRASEIDLDPGMTAEAALQRIVRSCAEQIVGNEAAVLAGMPEGVHQMRVGVRRLRALLSAFRRPLEDHDRWLSNELRWLGTILGAARNLDVFANELVGPAAHSIGDIEEVTVLNAVVAKRRAAAYAGAAEAICSPRYTALVLRLMRRSEDGAGGGLRPPGVSRPLGEIGSEMLADRLAVARRRGAGFARQSPEQRHRFRIAVKKLRYSLDILDPLYDPEKSRRLLRPVKRLQQELGEANDLRTSRELLAELACDEAGTTAIANAGIAVLDWHARRLNRRERKIRKHVAKIRNQASIFWT